MTLSQYTVSPRATLLEAAGRIAAGHARAVVVVEETKAIGILSEGDVLRALLAGADVHAPIEDYVSLEFKFLLSRDLPKALELAQRFGISLIPVLDSDFHLQDVVTMQEILTEATLP